MSTNADQTRRVVGIDLACRSWDDIGSAVTAFNSERLTEAVPDAIPWPSDDLTPSAVAQTIDAFARERDVAAVSVDGPQGWRDPSAPRSRPGVGRACERAAKTQGKTGPRGVVYPSTYGRWTQFSIDVFHDLRNRPGVELANDRNGKLHPRRTGYWLIECFPTSTWRTSGLDPLPGHRRASRSVVERYARRLMETYALPSSAVTSDHDHLQAMVSTLPAVGLLGGPAIAHARGEPARCVDGVLVEGLIWDAAPVGGASPAVLVRPGGSPKLIEEPDATDPCIQRGIGLFRNLVHRARAGDAVGISYKGFVEHLHGGIPFIRLRADRGGRPTSAKRYVWPDR